MIKFKKLGNDYYNAQYDILIVRNVEYGNWDLYRGNEWGCEAKTKRELVAHAQSAASWGK